MSEAWQLPRLAHLEHFFSTKETLAVLQFNLFRNLFLSSILLVAFTLAACGGNTSNSPTSAAPNNPPAATSAIVAPTDSPQAAATAAPANPTSNATDAPLSNNDSAVTVTKFNLNTASAQDFVTIPNVGQRMVREFNEYRPYVSILQFRKEIGKYVDQSQVAEYEKYVYVPINPNEADAATLQQIPGLDANEAGQLIAGRPYASSDAFIAKLTQFVSPDELTVAQSYLTP